MKPRAVVFDLDGVLFDSSRRYEKCREEARGDRKRFWDCFLSPRYMHLDAPIEENLEAARAYKEAGYALIIVSGRREVQREATLAQLRAAGLEPDELILRPEGDYRKDYIYKVSIIEQLERDYIIVAVYDDSERVINAVKERFPWITAVLVHTHT